MLRTALRPRWLALLGLVLVVCVAFGRLGLWQLNVSQNKAQAEALAQVAAAPTAPLDEVLRPQAPVTGTQVGRKITAVGEYEPSRQLLVTGRRLDGRTGSWVMTPMVVDTSGARLAVVRGFVDEGTPAPPAPTGRVTVTGTLEPQEGPPDARAPQPAGQIQTVDVSALVNEWGGDVYNAFAIAGDESPAPEGAAAQLTRVPPPVVDTGEINWRNFAYAIQWWIFAGFALYLWWRMVRDDHLLGGQSGQVADADQLDPTSLPTTDASTGATSETPGPTTATPTSATSTTVAPTSVTEGQNR